MVILRLRYWLMKATARKRVWKMDNWKNEVHYCQCGKFIVCIRTNLAYFLSMRLEALCRSLLDHCIIRVRLWQWFETNLPQLELSHFISRCLILTNVFRQQKTFCIYAYERNIQNRPFFEGTYGQIGLEQYNTKIKTIASSECEEKNQFPCFDIKARQKLDKYWDQKNDTMKK